MADPICDALPTPLDWPTTIDRTGQTTSGIVPVGGLGVDEGEYCDESIIESAVVSIPVTVDVNGPAASDYQITSSVAGNSSEAVWISALGGVVNAAGQLSGSTSGTFVFEVGAVTGQSPSALAGFAVGLTVAAGSVATFGEPTLTVTLNNSLCPEPDLGDPLLGRVELCLAPVSATDCDGNTTSVEALPTVVQGVVDVRVCPECVRDWTPVFQCVTGDYLGVGVGGRDILDGEQIIANLLKDCDADGTILGVTYLDPTDPSFVLPEDIEVGACPSPSTVTPRGCIQDVNGDRWDVFETDAGTTFYVNADGTAGVPAGKPGAWGSCCDCVNIDNLPLIECSTSAGATVETYTTTNAEHSAGIGLVGPNNEPGVKFDIGPDSAPPAVAAIHAAIAGCIADGNSPTVEMTDINTGVTSTMVLTEDLTTPAQYVYLGVVTAGSPSVGKLSDIVVTCPADGEIVEAVITHLDDCTIEALTAALGDCPVTITDRFVCVIADGSVVVEVTQRDCLGDLVSQEFFDPLDLTSPLGISAADVEECDVDTELPEVRRECLKNLDGDQFERIRVFVTPGATTPDSETWVDSSGTVVGQPIGPLLPCAQGIEFRRTARCFDVDGTPTPGWQIDVYTEAGDLLIVKYQGLDGGDLTGVHDGLLDPCDCVGATGDAGFAESAVVGGGKPSSWTFGGPSLSKMTNVALDPTIFGPTGTVPTSFADGGQLSPIDAAYLGTLDVYFDGYVPDGSWTPAELADLDAWVQAGGVIISTNDTSTYDAWADYVGTPNIGASTTTWEFTADGAAFYSGAFGTLAAGDTFAASGAYGQFDPAAVAAIPGSQVLAVDATSGNPTIYVAPRGSGWMLVMADEGPFRASVSAGNTIATNNDILLAGTYEWVASALAGAASEIPLPPELCACCEPPAVVSTISGCIDDPVNPGETISAFWHVMSDGTYEGPFTIADLTDAVECC